MIAEALDYVEEATSRETIFVVTADHGDLFGDQFDGEAAQTEAVEWYDAWRSTFDNQRFSPGTVEFSSGIEDRLEDLGYV